VVISGVLGFHGADHDTEEDCRMPSVTECNPGRNGTYYTDDEVADLLGISLGRLRNKLCAGNPMPPRIEPPGCRHRLWPCQAVHDWLDQFTISVGEVQRVDGSGRRRGRPTKQEERSRRR
jgi:hypothetical protein